VPVKDFQQAAWLDTGLTHDWVGDDFLPSQIVGDVGLAFGITALSAPLGTVHKNLTKVTTAPGRVLSLYWERGVLGARGGPRGSIVVRPSPSARGVLLPSPRGSGGPRGNGRDL
jgi:hypothetical protein